MPAKRETYLQKHFVYFFAGFVCVLSFTFMFYASHISTGQLHDNILIQSVTGVINLLTGAAGYFLGSSHSSKKKEDMMEGMISQPEDSTVIATPSDTTTTVTTEKPKK